MAQDVLSSVSRQANFEDNMRLLNSAAAASTLLLILCAIAHGHRPSSSGPDRDSSDENELLMMGSNPVVITAAQTKQRVSDSPVAVSVITAEDIRKSGITSIPDLLRSIPGVDVNDGNRGTENVAVRGFNAPFTPDKKQNKNKKHAIYQD